MFKKKKPEINLLPDAQKEESFSKDRLVLSLVIIFGLILATAAISGFGLYQKGQVNSLNKQINNLEVEGQNEVAKTAQLIAKSKQVLEKYRTFASSYPEISKRLSAFERAIPTQVQLDSLSVDSTGKAAFAGQAPNPEIIESFYQALVSENQAIKDVTFNSVSKGKDQYSFAAVLTFK